MSCQFRTFQYRSTVDIEEKRKTDLINTGLISEWFYAHVNFELNCIQYILYISLIIKMAKNYQKKDLSGYRYLEGGDLSLEAVDDTRSISGVSKAVCASTGNIQLLFKGGILNDDEKAHHYITLHSSILFTDFVYLLKSSPLSKIVRRMDVCSICGLCGKVAGKLSNKLRSGAPST